MFKDVISEFSYILYLSWLHGVSLVIIVAAHKIIYTSVMAACSLVMNTYFPDAYLWFYIIDSEVPFNHAIIIIIVIPATGTSLLPGTLYIIFKGLFTPLGVYKPLVKL